MRGLTSCLFAQMFALATGMASFADEAQTRPDAILDHLGDKAYVARFLGQIQKGELPEDLVPAVLNEIDLLEHFKRVKATELDQVNLADALIEEFQSAIKTKRYTKNLFQKFAYEYEGKLHIFGNSLGDTFADLIFGSWDLGHSAYRFGAAIPLFSEPTIKQMNQMPLEMLLRFRGRTTLNETAFDFGKGLSPERYFDHDRRHAKLINQRLLSDAIWFGMLYDEYVYALDAIYDEFYQKIENYEDPLLREALHFLLFFEKHERIIFIGSLAEDDPNEILKLVTRRLHRYDSIQGEANEIYHRFRKDKSDRLSQLSSPLGSTLRSLAALAINRLVLR